MSQPCFLSDVYEENHSNTNIHIPPCRENRVDHSDIMSPLALTSIPEQSLTKYKNICTRSVHERTTKLSQSNTYNISEQNIFHQQHKKRRASQPNPYQTMSMLYEPIAFDSNSLSPASPSPHNAYLSKRQMNELHMKRYKNKYRKKRRYSVNTTQHSLPKNTKTDTKRTKCKSFQYSLNMDENVSYINNTNATISRRKSDRIHKKRKRNKMQRYTSYDNSYNEFEFEDRDRRISDIKIKNSTSETNDAQRSTKKRKESDNIKRKKKKKKKATDAVHKRKKKKQFEPALFDKQILRVREGKLGQRVVTFSRRKSVVDTAKTPNCEDYNALIELQKSLDEERRQLSEERARMESLLKEMNEAYHLLKKERNEYQKKQKILLQNEIEIMEDRDQLQQKEEFIRKQQRQLVTETQRFDTVLSDFYAYQHTVNASRDKHTQLIRKWMNVAHDLMSNWMQSIMKPMHNMIGDILQYRNFEEDDANKLKAHSTKINEMYTLSKNMMQFEEIKKVQHELKHIPRPNMSKSQAMECEMRLQNKWRKYLSVRFADEYVEPSLRTESSSDISEMHETDSDELHIVNQEDIEIDDFKVSEIEIETEYKQSSDDESENVSDGDYDTEHTEFVRVKYEHQRTSASFIGSPPFLNSMKPFWCLQYDSPNEVESSNEEMDVDLSTKSNSSAVIHDTEDIACSDA